LSVLAETILFTFLRNSENKIAQEAAALKAKESRSNLLLGGLHFLPPTAALKAKESTPNLFLGGCVVEFVLGTSTVHFYTLRPLFCWWVGRLAVVRILFTFLRNSENKIAQEAVCGVCSDLIPRAVEKGGEGGREGRKTTSKAALSRGLSLAAHSVWSSPLAPKKKDRAKVSWIQQSAGSRGARGTSPSPSDVILK